MTQVDYKSMSIQLYGEPPDNLCQVVLILSSKKYCSRKLLEGSQFCYWHTPTKTKYSPDIVRQYFGADITLKQALEHEVATNQSLERAFLEGINLKGNFLSTGCNIQNGIFLCANISNAFLSYSNLEKANFYLANMNHTYLGDCKLAGVTFTGTGLFQAKFRNSDISNVKGLTKENFRGVKWGCIPVYRILEEYPQQCEPIYRKLTSYFTNQGLLDDASWASYRACVMKHKLLSKNLSRQWLFLQDYASASFRNDVPMKTNTLLLNMRWLMNLWAWCRSHMLRILMGYGEKPMRVIIIAGIVISTYAELYYKYGVIPDKSFSAALYFSIITFTTVGFGDLIPAPSFRLLVSSEALLGIFLSGLFLFCLGRRAIGRA